MTPDELDRLADEATSFCGEIRQAERECRLGWMGYQWEHLGDASRDVHRLMEKVDALASLTREHAALLRAGSEVVHQYHLWSEDANDGTYALWQKDGLINAIIALRAAIGGHQ